MALPTGSPVTLELRRRRGDGAAKIIHDVADGCARCVDLHVAGAVLVAARLAGFTALPWDVAALPFFAATGAAFAAQVRFLRTAAQLRLRPPAPDEFAYGVAAGMTRPKPREGPKQFSYVVDAKAVDAKYALEYTVERPTEGFTSTSTPSSASGTTDASTGCSRSPRCARRTSTPKPRTS